MNSSKLNYIQIMVSSVSTLLSVASGIWLALGNIILFSLGLMIIITVNAVNLRVYHHYMKRIVRE